MNAEKTQDGRRENVKSLHRQHPRSGPRCLALQGSSSTSCTTEPPIILYVKLQNKRRAIQPLEPAVGHWRCLLSSVLSIGSGWETAFGSSRNTASPARVAGLERPGAGPYIARRGSNGHGTFQRDIPAPTGGSIVVTFWA